MTEPLAVLGAGGRAGRAIVAEAVRRDLPVTAIVRDPARHPDLGGPNVTVVAADALDPATVVRAASGARAIVSAVAPFSGPPESFDGFDPLYYHRVADALLAVPGMSQIVVVGLFATLASDDGFVMDDPSRFPPALLPFARAQAEGIERLREAGGAANWLVLAPPPALVLDRPRSGHYELGDGTADPHRSHRPLGYEDLAVAVLDAVAQPPAQRTQLAVYG